MATTTEAARRRPKADPLLDLFAPLCPTTAEIEALQKVERTASPEFAKKLADLDRKYKAKSLAALPGVDSKIVNPSAFRLVTGSEQARQLEYRVTLPSYLGQLFKEEKLACDCLVPFRFTGLDVYTNMSGPETTEVMRGMIGAVRYEANEYTVWNPGDTDGKTRVHVGGQMHISFAAAIPQAGRWCLMMPSGQLWIRGHSRVVGHGNMTTSYDAKVWVHYYQVLQTGNALLEIAGGGVHYDGTRSEDRTRYFVADRYLPQRYLFFQAAGSETLLLTLRLEVDTAANEDGLATGVIDNFGFLANSTTDYDTFVVQAH